VEMSHSLGHGNPIAPDQACYVWNGASDMANSKGGSRKKPPINSRSDSQFAINSSIRVHSTLSSTPTTFPIILVGI
jgi:hypothetical protein